jgi:DNA-binding NtrC family response regulator
VAREIDQLALACVRYLPIRLRDGQQNVAVVLQDLSEVKLARRALKQQTEFETLLVNLAARWVEVRAEPLERAIHGALDELCKFYGLLRAAFWRFSNGFPVELAHESSGLGDHRLVARVRDREIRWLSSIHSQLFRDGAVMRLAPEPEPEVGRRRQPAPSALAIPVPARETYVLVCCPALGAPASPEHIDRLRSFVNLITALMSMERSERHPTAEKPNPATRSVGRKGGSSAQLVGTSYGLRQVLEAVDVVAPTEATVLIQGESGVGKELVARAIHERSSRAAEPLVNVNCASIPRELFESEFFGHVRGAFTGAHRDRVGRFELADGGTIFLDEVAEIPLELQSKLLRVLQEREFEPLGDHRTRRIDVRVIAATNRDLEALAHASRFRQDLYYRLSVFPIHVPPLRERTEDILALARYFVNVCSTELGREGLALSEDHCRMLLAHDWPGNVRELQNVVERAVIHSVRPPLRLELPSQRTKTADVQRDSTPQPFLTAAQLRDRERENILAALTKSGWRVGGAGGAAELLGMRPSTLRDRLQLLGIRRP